MGEIMLDIMRASDLWLKPALARSMYTHRRVQFFERLKWPLEVDRHGFERDQYDAINPIYVIVSDDAGVHQGSLRLLPTTGPTMIQDHFKETLSGQSIAKNDIWECTRFCLAPSCSPRIALKLLALTAHLMRQTNVSMLVAIFDEKMLRVYRRTGVLPTIIGSSRYGSDEFYAGFWPFEEERFHALVQASNLEDGTLEEAVDNFLNPWPEGATIGSMLKQPDLAVAIHR